VKRAREGIGIGWLAGLHGEQDVSVSPTKLVGIREVAHDVFSKLKYALFEALLLVEAEGGVVTGLDLLDEAFQRTHAVESEQFDRIECQAGDAPNDRLDAIE
jgi:hypothetical protein